VRQTPKGRVLPVLASALTLWACSGPVMAQTDDPETPEARLRDFIHYVLIDRHDAAELMARQLLSGDMPARAFADLVDSSGEDDRFRRAIGEAMRRDVGGSLEDAAARLEGLYEAGRLERARSPSEIERNIDLLTGQLQGRYLATRRLLTAGEYAVPQLYEALVDAGNPELQAVAQLILVEMGSQSVMPLCTALLGETGTRQRLIADVLGIKGYRTAVPFLASVERGTAETEVREACARAIRNLGGANAPSVGALFVELGEIFYAERPEVTSFPGEEYQLIWTFSPSAPSVTLTATPVLTEVYHEAMAMRMAEHAMGLEGRNAEAASLWVASNIKREIEQPADYDNPVYGSDRRSPAYFAVVAGMEVGQRVLARGLDTRNTPLARAAIEAITEIAGGSQLWAGSGSRRPLVEALGYANKRVQFEAALAFAAAQPNMDFDGADRVVPLLASAVRDASDRYAIVLTEEVEAYQRVRGVLEGAGYSVLPRGASAGELEDAIATTAGIDIIVTMLPPERSAEAVDSIRYTGKLAVTPVLMLLPPSDAAKLSPQYERDPMVMVRRTGLPGDLIAGAVEQLVEDASGGPIGQAEARDYADRAIAALRDLAVARNEVLDVRDAAATLVAAIGDAAGGRKLAIAEVLALTDDPRAQRRIVDEALAASGGQRAALLRLAADSAKRYGNRLEDRQVSRLVEVARSRADEEALAAAALLGALGVPTGDVFAELLGV
jgi:hypothetical protein